MGPLERWQDVHQALERALRRLRARASRDIQLTGGMAAALVLVAALAMVGTVARQRAEARAAFPLEQGRVRVSGLERPVEILRDRHGIPHVEAETRLDALFALGFVHAQDRLAQMDWLVRVARGRTAEVIGSSGLPADRLARTLDLGGHADREFEALGSEAREALLAYTRGVNARVARVRSGEVAPPLAVRRLGLSIEDWRPADSLAVLKLYAWSLSDSIEARLVLSDLLERLGGYGARRFFPRGPGDRVPRPRGETLTAAWRDPLRRAAGLEGRTIGSNAWVLGGAHTESGMPVLVADTHLETTVPAHLHVDHVRGGDLDVAGATLPGTPVFWTGHNRRVAWASTASRAAVLDLYSETLHPSRADEYHDGRSWRALERRSETIAVRGGRDEPLEVRSTGHGPLVAEIVGRPGEALALAWIGTRMNGPTSFEALLRASLARGAPEFLRALEDLREPVLAIVYADVNGEAGMHVAGWIPRREVPTGFAPLPGRARWYDWQGRVPFRQLPAKRLQQGEGWAIASDNPFEAQEGATATEWLWRTGVRGRRIEARLRSTVASGKQGLRRLASLQTDVGEGRGTALIASSLELAGPPERLSREAREIVGLLQDWDGRSTATSVGAAAFHVYLMVLMEKLFSEPLGHELLARYLALPQSDPGQIVQEIVDSAADGGDGDEWTNPERVGPAVRDSLRETWLRLSFKLGPNRAKWQWGHLHTLRFRPFAPHPDLERISALGPFDYGGSGSTVNTAEYDPGEPYRVRVASTFRFAVDAAELDEALIALAPGQSEHPRHPNFSDGVAGWIDGRFKLLATSRVVVEESSRARLLLEPVE